MIPTQRDDYYPKGVVLVLFVAGLTVVVLAVVVVECGGLLCVYV